LVCGAVSSSGRVRPDRPAELKIRLRHRGRGVGVFLPDLLLPLRKVPMQCGKRDACCVALLESGDTGRVIAAKAVSEDGDTLGVNVRALGEIVESRRARHFVVVAAWHVTAPPRTPPRPAAHCDGGDGAG